MAAVGASDGQAGAEAGFNLTVDATVVDTNDPFSGVVLCRPRAAGPR
jgi:hypothetical protein